MNIEFRKTDRGFVRADFVDKYGSQCSLQKSSLATEDAIWLGVHKDFLGSEATRMHLTQEHVRALLPFLTKFAETGELE